MASSEMPEHDLNGSCPFSNALTRRLRKEGARAPEGGACGIVGSLLSTAQTQGGLEAGDAPEF